MTLHSFPFLVSSSLIFNSGDPAEALVLSLIGNRWVQRLRRVAQSGAQRFVFMFSEYSRFGHSVYAAYLMSQVVKVLRLKGHNVSDFEAKLLLATSLLHDIGHLAPGSHMAWDVWFPEESDQHERLAVSIINEDLDLQKILADPNLVEGCKELLLPEKRNLPSWMYQLISGSSWNVDRGSWVLTDSIFSGFGLGVYNISELINSVSITSEGQLDFDERKRPTLTNFLVARNTLYSQVIFHPAVIGARLLFNKVVERLREGAKASFLDCTMESFLKASTSQEISLEDIFNCDDHWFFYHLSRWLGGENDLIVKDLSMRIINRDFLRAFRLPREVFQELYYDACELVASLGYDPNYYCLSQDLSKYQFILSGSGLSSEAIDKNFYFDEHYLFLPSQVAEAFESKLLGLRSLNTR